MRRTCILKTTFLVFGVATALVSGRARGDGAAASSSVRRQALDWLSANDNFNDAKLSGDVRNAFSQELQNGTDFVATFGAERMQSGRPSQVHLFAGQFFVFPLSDAQAAKLLKGPREITFACRSRRYEVQPARIELGQVKIDGADRQDPRKPVVGEVSYKIQARPPENLVMRLSYRTETKGGQSVFHQSVLHLKNGLSANGGTLRFSFAPLYDDTIKDDSAGAGPQVVFVDVSTLTEEAGPSNPGVKLTKMRVFSNSTAAMLDMTPSADFTPAVIPGTPSTLEGSKWRFGGTETTVEFLAGGRFRWNGRPGTGYWKQDGNSILLNTSDYTLFRLNIDGNTLKGTWERLQGGEAGQKNPSSLTKVVE
ncbi:MAG: hypothetical protein ABSG86_16725 [Thermoguttaceae bacterium]|jgi:hypothetical protein